MIEDLRFWNEMIVVFGTIAFAVTAVLAIGDEFEIDLLGATILGVITAIGGGTIRDTIIDVPVFWGKDTFYIYLSAAASVAAFYGRSLLKRQIVYSTMLYLDALGASLFAIQAADKVWTANFGGMGAPIVLGVVTAIGGGLLRDVLAGRKTLLMQPKLYATPVFLGCALYIALVSQFPGHDLYFGMGSAIFIFLFRSCAIHFDLKMPGLLLVKQ